MKKKLTFLVFVTMMLITLILANVQAQRLSRHKDTTRHQIYHTSPKAEIPAYLAIIAGASFGFKAMDKHAYLSAEGALALNPETLNSWDKPVAYYDPANFEKAQATSDVLLTVFVASPSLLLLDKKIRKDLDDFLCVFLSAHAADNVLYFSSVAAVRRPRPLTYNPEVPLSEKTGDNKTNSFFSGHVTWTATSSFLIAKMYSDYHHINGWKRVALYTGASVPPALVGYYRMQAGKHFTTDVITGFAIGAACGILAPELHRKKDRYGLIVKPFSMNQATGVSLIYNIR